MCLDSWKCLKPGHFYLFPETTNMKCTLKLPTIPAKQTFCSSEDWVLGYQANIRLGLWFNHKLNHRNVVSCPPLVAIKQSTILTFLFDTRSPKRRRSRSGSRNRRSRHRRSRSRSRDRRRHSPRSRSQERRERERERERRAKGLPPVKPETVSGKSHLSFIERNQMVFIACFWVS